MARVAKPISWNGEIVAQVGEVWAKPEGMSFSAVTELHGRGYLTDLRPEDAGIFDPIDEQEWQAILREQALFLYKGCARCR